MNFSSSWQLENFHRPDPAVEVDPHTMADWSGLDSG